MLWRSSWPGRFIYGALFNPEPMYVGCVYAHYAYMILSGQRHVCVHVRIQTGEYTFALGPGAPRLETRQRQLRHLPRSLLGVTGRPKQQVFTYPVGSFAPHNSGTGEKHAVRSSESTQGCMCTVRSQGRGLPVAFRKVRFIRIPRSVQVFSVFPLNVSSSL